MLSTALLVVVMAAPLEPANQEVDQQFDEEGQDLQATETKIINSLVAKFLRKLLKKPEKLLELVTGLGDVLDGVVDKFSNLL